MKKQLLALALCLTALCGAVKAQVVLNDFSATVNSGFTYFYGSFSPTGSSTVGSETSIAGLSQGSGFYSINSPSAVNSDVSKLEIFFAAPQNLTGLNFLSLAAQALAGNAAPSIRVFLYDGNGNSAYAAFLATSFPTGSFTTAIEALTVNSGFNAAAVESMVITGNVPSGTAAFSFSFDNLAAVATGVVVPEPSTYAAMLGAAALALAAYRRRRLQVS